MRTATRVAKVPVWLLLPLAGSCTACGGTAGFPSDDGDAASPDATEVAVAVLQPQTQDATGPQTDAVAAWPVGQGAAGAPLVPCSGDPSIPIWDGQYRCGTCGTDGFYPVVCSNGFLACPTSYAGSGGTSITVPTTAYVVGLNDYSAKTGQCAYVASAYDPSFSLIDPDGLTTARDPTQPLVLREFPTGGGTLSAFNRLLENRAQGEEALRSLVTLTDMTHGVPIAYAIGDPVRDATSGLQTLALTPDTPLAANRWYRVTVYPGEVQQLVKCQTLSRTAFTPLTTPEATDFYTYSRPMVGEMFIPYKGGGKGYFQFNFTEALVAADLAAYPMAVVAVDGVELSGCLMPYPCAGGVSAGPADLRLDVAALPTSFTAVTLRIPHAIRSINGGAILDGTAANPHATIDGDFAVYTFAAADMVVTDNNSVKRWYHTGM